MANFYPGHKATSFTYNELLRNAESDISPAIFKLGLNQEKNVWFCVYDIVEHEYNPSK